MKGMLDAVNIFNTKTCQMCGKEYAYRQGMNGTRYCSDACGVASYRKREIAKREKRKKERAKLSKGPCVVCGNMWRGSGLKRCPECRKTYGNNGTKIKCKVCGKECIVRSRTGKVCSPECGAILARKKQKEHRNKAMQKWQQQGCMCTKHTGMDGAKRGNISEALFDLLCATQGWENTKIEGSIASPSYDRVINRGSKWETVQVKTRFIAGEKRNAVKLANRKGACHAGDYDLLAAVDCESGVMWLIPQEEIVGKSWLRPEKLEYEKYKTHALYGDAYDDKGGGEDHELDLKA